MSVVAVISRHVANTLNCDANVVGKNCVICVNRSRVLTTDVRDYDGTHDSDPRPPPLPGHPQLVQRHGHGAGQLPGHVAQVMTI